MREEGGRGKKLGGGGTDEEGQRRKGKEKTHYDLTTTMKI